MDKSVLSQNPSDKLIVMFLFVIIKIKILKRQILDIQV